jgi:hypothetical protein
MTRCSASSSKFNPCRARRKRSRPMRIRTFPLARRQAVLVDVVVEMVNAQGGPLKELRIQNDGKRAVVVAFKADGTKRVIKRTVEPTGILRIRPEATEVTVDRAGKVSGCSVALEFIPIPEARA